MENKEFLSDLDHILSWEEYFMDLAILSSKRSKDPVTKVGACIVSEDKRILSFGYNGFPNKCSDKDFNWLKENKIIGQEMFTKYFYVVHAELNAILNFKGSRSELEGSTIYVTLFPCNECAKAIIQSGIKHIVYLKDKESDTYIASKQMFNAAGVTYKQGYCTGMKNEDNSHEKEVKKVESPILKPARLHNSKLSIEQVDVGDIIYLPNLNKYWIRLGKFSDVENNIYYSGILSSDNSNKEFLPDIRCYKIDDIVFDFYNIRNFMINESDILDLKDAYFVTCLNTPQCNELINALNVYFNMTASESCTETN